MTIAQYHTAVAAEQMAESCSAEAKAVAKKERQVLPMCRSRRPVDSLEDDGAPRGFASIGACKRRVQPS